MCLFVLCVYSFRLSFCLYKKNIFWKLRIGLGNEYDVCFVSGIQTHYNSHTFIWIIEANTWDKHCCFTIESNNNIIKKFILILNLSNNIIRLNRYCLFWNVKVRRLKNIKRKWKKKKVFNFFSTWPYNNVKLMNIV